MDITITKKREPPRKLYVVGGLIALTIFVGVRHLWLVSQVEYSIDRNSMVTGEVRRGKYSVSVRGTGMLIPENIHWLSANVEATVERLALKAGNTVTTGDLIVQLRNPQLVQELSEIQWEFKAMNAEFKAAQVAQESSLQQQRADVLSAKLDYDRGMLEYNAHSQLVREGAVSKLDYDRARLSADQFKQRWISVKEELKQMEQSLIAQNDARSARLEMTRKRVERASQQVDDLTVKATMDSIVLEIPLEPGQRVAMGTNIAKLAQQGSLIAELQVSEIQIRDVAPGQRVIIDTRNNEFEGIVLRVDPTVVSGNVQVDVAFSEPLPDDARPDLSVDGEIKITEIKDTLYVERPLFIQSKSHSSVYRLSKDEKFAVRTKVEVGYGSINQIQIIDGLRVGDKIITSDPTRFETYNKVRIN